MKRISCHLHIYQFKNINNIVKVTLPDAQKRKGQNSWHIFYHAWSFFDLGSIFLLPRFFLRTIGMYILYDDYQKMISTFSNLHRISWTTQRRWQRNASTEYYFYVWCYCEMKVLIKLQTFRQSYSVLKVNLFGLSNKICAFMHNAAASTCDKKTTIII